MPGRLPLNVIGIVSQMEWALVFLEWAGSLNGPPSAELIRRRFDVSRATSYRYKSAYDAMVERKLIHPAKGERA